jgi:hypothetical protein
MTLIKMAINAECYFLIHLRLSSFYCHAECHYAKCHLAGCHGAVLMYFRRTLFSSVFACTDRSIVTKVTLEELAMKFLLLSLFLLVHNSGFSVLKLFLCQ